MRSFNYKKDNDFTNSNKSVFLFLSLTSLLIIGVGYALWKIPKTKGNPSIISTGCFKTIFTSGTSNIDLIDAYPISDEQGALTNAYNFTIENTCSLAASYQLNLETLNDTTLSLSRIKISIDNEEPILLSSLDNTNSTISDAASAKILKVGKLTAGTTKSYSIRVWLDDTNGTDRISSDVYKGKIVVTTTSNKN